MYIDGTCSADDCDSSGWVSRLYSTHVTVVVKVLALVAHPGYSFTFGGTRIDE